jgi:RNA polymerase sigma factor (sigma-70 family)
MVLRKSQQPSAAPADTEARAVTAVEVSEVMARVAGLPPGDREALLLFAWEELSYQEIAEALAIPIGTVRSRINRARVRLRELHSGPAEEEVEMIPTVRRPSGGDSDD